MEEEEIKQLSKGLAKMGAEVTVEVLTEEIVKNWNMPLNIVLASTRLRRLAELGGWTAEDVEDTQKLLKAMMQKEQVNARMFLLFACCLDLIPPDR